MKLPRRHFLRLAASVAFPAIPHVAWAQNYPTRPVRLIHGYTPGGATDLVARIIVQWLSSRLGQSLVVESKPGAATNIAAQAVANSSPDGYTLLVVTSTHAVNATFGEKPPYDLRRDILPIAGLVTLPLAITVNPSVPAKDVFEFIAYAKANPGKLNVGSSAAGGLTHLAGELFKSMAGIDMVHVPYRGAAPLTTDLIGGQVQVAFESLAAYLPQIQSGALRALAVTTSKRLDMLPNLPAVNETVPGYEAIGWYGVGAPKGTPSEIIQTLSREINAGLADASVKARLVDAGALPMMLSPDGFGAYVDAEMKKWAKLRVLGIKVE